jgi:BirA family biotin operon repressor/biotin-[acetyl-CoA-carboxylase] ligase
MIKDKPLLTEYSHNLAGLTQYAAVTVCRVLCRYGVHPVIKWPNDILTARGKLAGILSEAVADGNGILAVIVGIGINLNSDPETLKLAGQTATSVFLETGEQVKKNSFVTILLDLFFAGCEEFLRKGFSGIRDEYCGFFSINTGRVVKVASAGQLIEGKILGVDAAGCLLLENEISGNTSIHAGEIQW